MALRSFDSLLSALSSNYLGGLKCPFLVTVAWKLKSFPAFMVQVRPEERLLSSIDSKTEALEAQRASHFLCGFKVGSKYRR